MESAICLRFLGTVQAECDGEVVRDFRSRKALALLGYLAVQDRRFPRERLADLFWEDQPEARGRANLSWVLSRISARLPNCLQTDRHTVRFRCPANCWVDTDAFAELAKQGDPTSAAAAVQLYRGDFLEGLYLEACAEFEIWLVSERERWRQLTADLLKQLVAHHSQRGDYDEGLRFARRLLALEPWREETHQQVMRLLAWSGQRAAALAQYEACRRAMVEELGVEPAEGTVRLYEQICAEELETPVSAPVRLPDFSLPLPSFLKDEKPVEKPTFVARERELAQLTEFLDMALAGQVRVVFVTGDAGQGKTALLQEFVRRAQAAHSDLVVAGGNGNAHTGVGDPCLPFREVLGLLAGDVEARWTAGAMGREQARRLWSMLPLTVQALVETGPDLIDTLLPGSALLGWVTAMEMMIPGKTDWLLQIKDRVEHRATVPGGPGPQQSDLFEQYTQLLRSLAQERPLLLVLDDLQWADPGSIGLLFHLGRRIEDSRILIVGAYRPAEVALGRGGERHPLAPVVAELKRHYGEIEVDLGQAERQRFVDAFLDSQPNRLGDAFRETLYRQTEGHPLFTVELVRGMEERGDLVRDVEGCWIEEPALDWETLPARVEAVIAEGIDRLPRPLQQVLRTASVEGETFTAEVVARIQAVGEREMVECLSGELDREYHLVRAQGIQRLETGSLSHYRFRHILFQKYLYNSLDAVERVHLHKAVGEALEGLCQERDVAPQLARHFQEAGVVEKAVAYLRQAGERAVRMSAHEEAVAHYRQALALLERLPESVERDQAELMLQVGLVASLQVVKGFGNPELDRIYARARKLCRRTGETPQLLPVLVQLALLYGLRGEHQAACEVAQQHLYLVERFGDTMSIVPAHYVVGWNQFFLGNFVQARLHLEQAVDLYDLEQHRILTFLYGYDAGVAALSTLSWVLWFLGYPDQALRRNQETLALARELAYPYSLAQAQWGASLHHLFCRDAQRILELIEACIRLSAEHEFPYWLTVGIFFRGVAMAQQGQAEEGIAQMQQALPQFQAVGLDGGRTCSLSLLAEALGKMERVEEGLDLLAEALEIVYRKEQHWYEVEVHRLRGELLLMQKEETKAEACFHEAIEVARQQSARSWELRATVSLCRLWQRQGKREKAHQRLAEIYGWFTEGFDTADLLEARALLEELS